jgi:hypothetical protein
MSKSSTGMVQLETEAWYIPIVSKKEIVRQQTTTHPNVSSLSQKVTKLVQNFHQNESSANYRNQLSKSLKHLHLLLLVARNLKNK